MITKEKIQKILADNSQYLDSSLGNVILEDKFSIIIDKILSELDSDNFKYVLYKAGARSWNKYGTYNTKEEMIDDLINLYGFDELKDCDDCDMESILNEGEFRYEIV